MTNYLKSFMCADLASLVMDFASPDYREHYNLAMRSLLWRQSPVFDKLTDGDLSDEYIEVFFPEELARDPVEDYDGVVCHLKNLFSGFYDKDGDRPMYMLPDDRLYHFTQEYR